MAEDQRPRGELGLPRFSDIGPLVSHHNTPATECDIENCFNGHSKAEVIKSIRDAYEIYSQQAEDEFLGVVEDFIGIFIVGSVARGNFGCRNVDNKVLGLVNGEVMLDIQNKSIISRDEASRRLKIAQRNADNAPEYADNIENEFGDFLDESTTDQIEKFTCSDIDIFIFTGLSENVAERLDDELFFQMLELVPDAERKIIGKMGIEPGIKSIEELERPAIISIDEFDQIIEKYYK